MVAVVAERGGHLPGLYGTPCVVSQPFWLMVSRANGRHYPSVLCGDERVNVYPSILSLLMRCFHLYRVFRARECYLGRIN